MAEAQSVQDLPFATYVVGSLPRSQWVRDVIEDRKAGRISEVAADELFDSAILSAIRMQERAGLDYISDGEWRRNSYIAVVSEHVDGFENGLMPNLLKPDVLSDPAVVSQLESRGNLATDAARFLRSNTDRRTIVTIPSPYILGWRMWHPEASKAAYQSRQEFMEACVPILRDELRRLAEAGVDHVQIDEPWLLMLLDPDHRARVGIREIDYEMEMCVRMANAVLEGADGLSTSLHLCNGHFRRQSYSSSDYLAIIDALGEINVGRLALEFSSSQVHAIGSLARFPKGKTLGLGVINNCNPEVESPEKIVQRAEAALEYVPSNRITLNPDCGFSPSSQNPMDFDEAYRKLSAMCLAAQMLRDKHG